MVLSVFIPLEDFDMMTQSRRLFFVLLGGFSLCLLWGCGGKDPHLRKVTGIVTYQGETVAGAAVQFYPVDSVGEPAAGKSDSSGRYTITAASAQQGGSGTKPGKYKVLVTKKEDMPPDPLLIQLENKEITYKEYMDKSEERKRTQPMPDSGALKSLIPVQYSKIDTTPLEFTVEDKRTNQFDIELTD